MPRPLPWLPHVLVVTLALAAATGCVSTPRITGPVNVFVTAKGVATFRGEQFGADLLPRRLSRSGVEPEQEIRVHLEDVHNNKRLMTQIHNDLRLKGFTHILILDEPRASSEVIGEPGTRIESTVSRGAPPAANGERPMPNPSP